MRGKGAFSRGLLWAGVAGVGAIVGLLLGNFVIGHDVASGSNYGSYADVTGNPEALGVAGAYGEPCYDCGPGYGASMRHAAAGDTRMDEGFRELGAVQLDDMPATDDYAYGGSFDDPAAARTIVMQSPVPAEVVPPAAETPPPTVTALTVAPASEPETSAPAQ